MKKNRKSFSLKILNYIYFYTIFEYLLICKSTEEQIIELTNKDETRSRMIFVDGNIFFIAGLGKNISFNVSSGSSIQFGNTNILDLPNSTEVVSVKNLLSDAKEKMIGFETTLKMETSEWQNKMTDLLQKHSILTKQITSYANDTYQRAKTNKRARLLILRLTKQIERLYKLIATDECLILGIDTCKNGGTCIDGFGKFQCLCPAHFQGKHCELRIDECSLYSGTAIGCQNGARCTNNPTIPGFSCNCTSGWHGLLCEHSENICDSTDDICGIHGHCIQSRSSQSAMAYRCLCEPGFQQGGDPNNPICVDVDECIINNPCYPGTECINMPGSFKCGSCPSGLIGNGLHCLDFDECENDLTNDCSKQPPVDCINIHGSYKCSECPIGYISKEGEKQGQICQKIDICNNPPLLNGGCSPVAKCVNEPEFRCICPIGMIGNGIGPDGCEKVKQILNGTDENLCIENDENKSCLNGGTCQAISLSEIRCLCPENYFGVRCEHPNPCLSRQFCSGHGHCQSNPLGCICFKGFYGPRCQFQEDGGCGFHTSNETGELIYERTSPSPLFVRWTCTWHIQMFDTRKVLQINFLNLTAPRLFEVTSKGCENAFVTLTIYDGADPIKSPTLASTQIVNMCHGEDFENPFKHPFFTSTNKAVIRLSSRIQGRSTYLHLKWIAKKPSCGGRFSNPNGGRIDYYYNYNNKLLEEKKEKEEEEIGEKACIWYLNVPPQFHIELNIQVLRLPSNEIVNCSANKLELFDNQMPSNRTLSLQLCSSLSTNELPNIIRTSGPFATIYLKINEQQLNKQCKSPSLCSIGFSITYKTIELATGCGGKIKAEETSSLLQSPNYPNIYFPNLDCLWVLQPNIINNNSNENNEIIDNDIYLTDQKVEILFEHFDVPTTITKYANPLLRHVTMNSCSGDFLQIVEKELTYCNMNKPSFSLPIIAPFISLKFHSDNSIGGTGFSIRYKSICQKDFILPNGTISPPNFPESSLNPFKCTYRIIAKPSQAIRLRFDKIGFTTSFGNCFQNNREKNLQIQDYVEFSGGHSSNEVANKRYICPRYPFIAPGGEIITSGIKPFTITYSTSGSSINKGFLFSYETFDIGCGGIFTINKNGEQKLVITSPNYPEPYISFMYCVYFLSVPIGKALRLSFDVFDIENVAHRDDCDFDNVRIFDKYIDDNEHGQLLGKFCGKALPPPLISNSGQMAVVFISDRSVSGSGFSAKFQAIDLTSHCDRTFTASSGEFIFDFRDFEQNEYCDYKIQISSNKRILLNILNISSPCDYGTLIIKNGPSEQSPGFAGLFGESEICNENPAKQLISQGNRLFLRFRSITNREIRFSLRYEQYESGCGGHIAGFSGAISTPQYPHKDSHSLRCEWLIAVTPGNKIQFKIIKLDNLDSEDSDGNCSPFSRNLLEIYELKYGGENTFEHLIERYCRRFETNNNILPLISSTNSLNVRFSQHGGSHHSPIFGFLAEFSTICTDLLLEGLHGTLQSPGYPNRVIEPRNCNWKIRTPSGSRIKLQFHLFRITDIGNVLDQKYYKNFARIRSLFCKQNYLKINSNEINQIIWIKNGKTIKSNSSSKISEQFCLGIAEPIEIISKQNQLNLEFYSRNEPENHFWISWHIIGCSGIITQNGSRLIANASEGADFVGEEPFRKCIWFVKAPIGYNIQVNIERMQTEQVPTGQKCFEVQPADFNDNEKTRLRDGVQFYAVDSNAAFESLSRGDGNNNLPLKAFCGQLKNINFTWGGNSAVSEGLAIIFSYHTDTTQILTDTLIGAAFFGDGTFEPLNDQIVFSAKINFLPISTEGNNNNNVIFVDPNSDSFIQSPNYPKPYPRSIELTWKFVTSEGFRLSFQILNFTSPVLGTSIFDRRGNSETMSSLINSNNSSSLNPEDYICGYHMLYIRGGLIFSEEGNIIDNNSSKQINGDNLFYGSITQTKYKICKDIRINPIEITMEGLTNTSIVTFRGAPYDQIISDSSVSQKIQLSIGFRLRIYAKCGGILLVNKESKIINTANIIGLFKLNNNNNTTNSSRNICEWIMRLNESYNDYQQIFVRVEQLYFSSKFEFSADNEPPQLEFFCGTDSKGIIEEIITTKQQHFHEFVCDGNQQAKLIGRSLEKMKFSSFLISYDVASSFCGGQINDNNYQGRLALNPILSPTDCEWTINTVKGSHISVQIISLLLPISEFCTISFLEFRENNSSGPLIGRFCGNLFPSSIESTEGPIYIRLRHKYEEQNGNEKEDNNNNEQIINNNKIISKIELKYLKVYGQTSSHIIESPPEVLNKPIYWHIATQDPDNWIQFGFAEYILSSFSASLTVHPIWCFLDSSTSEEKLCLPNDPLSIKFSDLTPPEQNFLYTLRSNKATIVFNQNINSKFKLYWKEIFPILNGEYNNETTQIQKTNINKQLNDGFNCGGELIPTYKIQTLNSPIDQTTMKYNNNERCKWTLRRPQFSNILFVITNLDLEIHPKCQYDWLAIGTLNYEKSTDLDNFPSLQRICEKQQISTSIEINSADNAFIYFYTDRSRTLNGGFSLNYSLSCNSIELWLPSQGIFDTQLSLQQTLLSDNSNLSIKNLKCHWSILVLSRRDIFIQALDMDLAPRDWSSQECLNDALEFSSTPFYSEETIANRSLVHCGQEKFNLTITSGYLFIRYKRALPIGRGFKLHFNEIIHDCSSSIIQLDEFESNKIINSPEFPLPSPNSLDCNWIISAPSGRRLQFTIDPKTFLLQNPISGEHCEEDYLEIRDGSSHLSTLVGRFCETNAPSTFISTGEHLYIRYVTDSDSESPGWNASISLSSCGGSVVLINGQNSTIHSPNFPDIYPTSLNCEWTIFAPRGHFVEAMIEHFWLSSTENCSSEFFTIYDNNSTGDILQKPICSKFNLNSGGFYRSQHRSLLILFVVNYIKNSNNYISASTIAKTARLFCLARKCGFSIKLWSSKLSCGGIIKDNEGIISLPYGNNLMAEMPLFCKWNFLAGIGYRYLLDFELIDNNEEYNLMLPENTVEKTKCFIDLLFYDGIDFVENNNILGSNSKYFCTNKKRIITTTDVSILKFDTLNCGENNNFLKGFCNNNKFISSNKLSTEIDWQLLNNKQFKIKYTKVPKDLNNASCMYELTMPGNLSLSMSKNLDDQQQQISFCHIQIRKLNPDFITLHLQIINISFYYYGYINDKLSNKCLNWESQFLIKDENSDPIDFEQNICRNNFIAKNNHTSIILINSQLDIYAFKLSANLILNFHECGGLINERSMGMSGELNSPGFETSSNYSNGLECLWLLRAPEGFIVEIKIITMDLEYHIECAHDVLQVIAGERQSSAVIHRYCNSDNISEDQKLAERFKYIRSSGRSLTLHFHTDSSITARGFSLQFTFSLPNPLQCGYNINSLSGGFIKSPNYPLNDYLDNTNCLWDLQVPNGYHIILTFEYFDIAQSIDCKKDFLKISEEHQSRAIVPLLSYYFYFDHESPGQYFCGNQLPKPFTTESNRVKINFTTDSHITAKGFKLRWEAVCGGVIFRNNHGVITSPNYPINYPNEAKECNYLINPEVQPGITQIITLKVLDFDLDNKINYYNEQEQNNNPSKYLCSSDYLEIKDVEQNITIQLLCGYTFQAVSSEAISIKGPIGVRFVTIRSQFSSNSSKWKNHRGFKLSYALSDCGGEVNLSSDQQPFRSQSVSISSPSFPLPYHHSLDCIWNISASSDRIISYKFTDLNIETGVEGDCPFDSVEIFDGQNLNNQTRQLIICGDKAPDGELKSTGSGLIIRFKSDHSTNFEGFRMVLTATLGPSNGCGGSLKALENNWQKLSVPIDPITQHYFPNLRCEWNIEAERGNLIEIRIIELKLEQKLQNQQQQQNVIINSTLANNIGISLFEIIPCFDYIAIYDGQKLTSPLLLNPSCNIMPSLNDNNELNPNFISSHRYIDVFFSSDSTTELPGAGFQAEYRAIKSDCGGAFLANTEWSDVTFTSERTLKRTNQRHKRCRWFIYTEQQQPLEVIFEQFSFPSTSGNCMDEFFELRDVGTISQCQHPSCATEPLNAKNERTIRTCGDNAPQWYISSTSVIQLTASVLLQSQFSANFRIKFRILSSCNRSIEIDGNVPNGVSLASGRIISPNYPHSPYLANSSCTTKLIAAEGHHLFLVFKHFELEKGRHRILQQQSSMLFQHFRRSFNNNNNNFYNFGTTTSGSDNCLYDYLTICCLKNNQININNNNSLENIQTFCGSWLPPSIISENNKIELVLKTDSSIMGSGYEINYYSIKITNSNNLQIFELSPIRERTGALTSINYPNEYPPNCLLRATLIPPTGFFCTVNILNANFGEECGETKFPAKSALSQLDTTSTPNVQVTDFSTLNWQPWPCLIDSNSPHKVLIPPGNRLFIEFRSDSNLNNDGNGFRLIWDCEDINAIYL